MTFLSFFLFPNEAEPWRKELRVRSQWKWRRTPTALSSRTSRGTSTAWWTLTSHGPSANSASPQNPLEKQRIATNLLKAVSRMKQTERGVFFTPMTPFFPLQSTQTPVRAACLTPSPSSPLKGDTLWPSALQARLLCPGTLSGVERVRCCLPSCARCRRRGSVLLDSNIPRPCSICCTATGGRSDPAWPPAPNQNQYPAGLSLRGLESLWTLL